MSELLEEFPQRPRIKTNRGILKTESDLIVEWPSKTQQGDGDCGFGDGVDVEDSRRRRPLSLTFDLAKNTIHPFHVTQEQIASSWTTSKEKNKFRKSAIRDAKTFREMIAEETTPEERYGQDWDEHLCTWGIEHIISKNAIRKTLEKQECHRKWVFDMQKFEREFDEENRECDGDGGVDRSMSDSMALALSELSKEAELRAQRIGSMYERELYS